MGLLNLGCRGEGTEWGYLTTRMGGDRFPANVVGYHGNFKFLAG